MALNLTKGDKLNLQKDNGQFLTQFCVGLNWGAIVKKGIFGFGSNKEGVDLDASAVLFDENNQLLEAIYFGRLISSDGAVRHSGDDLIGDTGAEDDLDNEIISFDLPRLHTRVHKILLILNSYKGQDFATIPYAYTRLYEGTPSHVKEVFAKFNVAAEPKYRGTVAMVMGKLYKYKGNWKFETIGEPTTDKSLQQTILTAQNRFL
ncbi:MAG: hypothetical protein RL329_3183 [Bacteroidota bacterium]|jgi:tellurium resistance protein TerZ